MSLGDLLELVAQVDANSVSSFDQMGDQMGDKLRRSIKQPYRTGLSHAETWQGPDRALIVCWEVGRRLREKDPELASRASDGELVSLPWKGGTGNFDELPADKKSPARYGVLKYLAMWQGLRGDDLDIDVEAQTTIVCTRTKRTVIFDLSTAVSMAE